MKKFNFKKIEQPKDKLFISIRYVEGDGDHYDQEEFVIKDIKFSEIDTKIEELSILVNSYRKLRKILDNDSRDRDYKNIAIKYGQIMADMYDDSPSSEYGNKNWIDDMKLAGYDDAGNRWECNIPPIK